MQTDSESAFFEHLSSLSAEYEAWFQKCLWLMLEPSLVWHMVFDVEMFETVPAKSASGRGSKMLRTVPAVPFCPC